MSSAFVYVSGNQHKLRQMKELSPIEFESAKLELDEIQSLDLKAIVEHKARQAYALLQKPVLVEDVSLGFDDLGGLPGPFIKWFNEALTPAGLHRIIGEDRRAKVTNTFAFFDGESLKFFEASAKGVVVDEPRGEHGFGFDTVFVPDGYSKTNAEFDPEEYKDIALRAQVMREFAVFIAAYVANQ